jgi:hypothetical protein
MDSYWDYFCLLEIKIMALAKILDVMSLKKCDINIYSEVHIYK